MKSNVAKGGAITSALAFAFCWQIPLVLASFGLGSFTFAVWLAKYRWIFMAITFIFLGFAFYKTYKNREKSGPWSIRMLYGTTALSVGLVVFTLVSG
jgi:hypothetical protein